MKIEASKHVKTNAVSSNFKISENAGKLFMMLSTHLYANKENAVIYELATNAYDEHVLAGVPETPIHITFPTILDSHLRIRDFGRGLSEEDVYRLLCTYGESTKSESNDFVGSWGIGFKSCASVTNSWNVVSHHKGTKSQYLIFVSADGIPNITKIRDDETTETGIEIVIPVHRSRYYQWENVIRSLFTHFPVRPVIKNLSVNYQPHITYTHGDWSIIGNKVVAVTSFREYQIDVNKIKTEIDKSMHHLLDFPLNIKFDIGTLDLSISRETLQYTQKTIEAISAKLTKIRDHFAEGIASVTGKDSLEYRENLVKYVSNGFKGVSSYAINPFVTDILKTHGKFNVSEYPKDVQRYYFEIPSGSKIRVSNHRAKVSQLKKWFNCWRTEVIIYDPDTNKMGLDIKRLESIKFFVADVHGSITRVRDYCVKHQCYGVMLDDNIFPTELQRMVIKTSSLPKPVRQKRTPTQKVMSNLFVWSGRSSFNRTVKQPDDKSCFVVIKNALTGETEQRENIDLWKTLRDNGYEVFGVKGQLFKGMLTPTQLAEKIVKEYDQVKLQQHYDHDSYYQAMRDPICKIAKGFKTAKQSVWNELHDALQSVNKVEPVTCQFYFDLCDLIQAKPWSPKVQKDVSHLLKKVYNHYGMLSHIGNYELTYNSGCKEAVKQYVEQIS